MSDRGTRPPKRLVATGATLALALALAGCGGGGGKSAGKQNPPPPPSTQPESAANAAPGALDLKSSTGLRKPVTYNDKITVKIGGIRYVKNKADGPGQIAGRVVTIFTLSFTNGSAKPLDLNQVRVVAKYGPRRAEAKPTSYANINDFYGTVPPGQGKKASYAFEIPPAGYKSVVLGVKFDAQHKAALFAGALRP
ncbi:hypothetical protein [Actinomadura macra]|uniref:hypothetical protein n=1 Tax=Actinomadura macra TaxID=46164 RepID=UPI00082EB97A|nr:hypothetical protein [Actinomadura macra]